MTQQDLDRIVRTAVRQAQQRGVRIALTGYLILTGGVVLERHISSNENQSARAAIVDSGTAVAVNACNERFRDRKQLRAVLIETRSLVRKNPRYINEEERSQMIQFYNDRLDQLPMPDCRPALKTLSDDPNMEVVIPEPLFISDSARSRPHP